MQIELILIDMVIGNLIPSVCITMSAYATSRRIGRLGEAVLNRIYR
jgi:hypothetical protein